MIPLIFLILTTVVTELKSEKALIIEASPLKAHFKDLGNDPEEKFSRILTFCPASTQQEKEFDQKVSLSGNSLFSRKYHPISEYVKNIQQDICDKSFEPVLIYDSEYGQYEIGYELYYEDGQGIKFYQGNETYYHHYRSIQSTKNQTDYEIMDQISPPHDFAIRYDAGQQKHRSVKFNFTDGSRTLVFYWMPILAIKSLGYNKHITSDLSYWQGTYNLSNKCEFYHLSDENIYSEQNQEIHLKDISIPASVSEANHKTKSCGQVYGCLVNSQIAPLQYFLTHAEKLASCSHTNMIPVWKTIAEGQLKKVDAYTMALDSPFHPYKVFGTSGVLKMKKTTSPEEEPQEIHLSDPQHQKIIQIPRIIYRIIDHHCLRRLKDEDPRKFQVFRYAAAIIIHNDPSPISDDERLCSKESTLSGWDKITNEDPRCGLTYVCPVTEELNDKLGAYDNITSATFEPLNLTAVPYSYLSQWSPSDEIFYQNYTSDVDRHFERILRDEFA